MKKILILLLASLVLSNACAEEKTAEQLVASLKKADMTYRQLMEVMGRSSSMMQEPRKSLGSRPARQPMI